MMRKIPAIVIVALVVAAPAGAAAPLLRAQTVVEPPAHGLPVTGPLQGFVVTSAAHIVVPARWHARRAAAGRARFTVVTGLSCHYDVVYTVTSAVGPDGAAADLVSAELPALGPHYLLDSGTHGRNAFRVVRQRSVAGRIRVNALWAGLLTRRGDIAPAGQVAWTRIRVTARSRAGDECHAGTWRENLGPDIGDSLAIARTHLHFTRTA